jgi:hypothetical protein
MDPDLDLCRINKALLSYVRYLGTVIRYLVSCGQCCGHF